MLKTGQAWEKGRVTLHRKPNRAIIKNHLIVRTPIKWKKREMPLAFLT